MTGRKRKSAQFTVLLVGEGTTDCAFLRHIKSLYISRGCGISVTVRNAHGKGPDHVVDYAIRQYRNADYDRVVVLLDTDIEMTTNVKKRAKTKKLQIIGSIPCLEGLLLKILDKNVPVTSDECKAQCGRVLPERLTSPEDYRHLFPKEVIDKRHSHISELATLINCFSFEE